MVYLECLIEMKKNLPVLVFIPLLLIFTQCKDSSTDNGTENTVIYEKDSISMYLYDTVFGIVSSEPRSTGNVNYDMKLDFDAETNLDSINGVPYLSVGLDSATVRKFTFFSSSRTEINKHHTFILNTQTILNSTYPYRLFLDVTMRPYQIGLKYVVMRNIKLVRN